MKTHLYLAFLWSVLSIPASAQLVGVYTAGGTRADFSALAAPIQGKQCALLNDALALYVHQKPLAYFAIADQVDDRVCLANRSICAKTHRWNFGNGSASDAFEPQYQCAAEGYHKVFLSVGNACGVPTYSERAYISPPEVATAFFHRKAFRLYPNPTAGHFWLQTDAAFQSLLTNWHLMDNTGHMAWPELVIAVEEMAVNAQSLPAGNYPMVLRVTERWWAQRVQFIG